MWTTCGRPVGWLPCKSQKGRLATVLHLCLVGICRYTLGKAGKMGGCVFTYVCKAKDGFARRGSTRRRHSGLWKGNVHFSLRWEFQPECQLASSALGYRANSHAGSRVTWSFWLCRLLPVTVLSLLEPETTCHPETVSSQQPIFCGLGWTDCTNLSTLLPSWFGPFPAFLSQVWHCRDHYYCCCVCILWEHRHHSLQPDFSHSFPT